MKNIIRFSLLEIIWLEYNMPSIKTNQIVPLCRGDPLEAVYNNTDDDLQIVVVVVVVALLLFCLYALQMLLCVHVYAVRAKNLH